MVRAGFDKFPHGFSVFSRVDYFFSHDFSTWIIQSISHRNVAGRRLYYALRELRYHS